MLLRLLCLGDVVGGPGRHVLREAIADLVPRHNVDCVIVNAENAAAGSGITALIYQKIVQSGANLITLGDHTYRRREAISVLETSDNIVRPANLPSRAPGKEFAVYETASGHRVAVVSVLGRLFMRTVGNCPFAATDRVLAQIPKDVRIVVVDMHAEATSEKIALGWHLDGRISALFGTHTHVPTGDECVLPKGTAYITDLGMSGPYDSVLGRCKEQVLSSMITGVSTRLEVATGDARACGVLITVESGTGRATAIERICFHGTSKTEMS